LTSDYHGPLRGSVVIGRFLDAAALQRMSEAIHLPLQLEHLGDRGLPAGLVAGNPGDPGADGARVVVQNGKTVVGSGLLRDISGRPALVLSFTLPRDIYLQGRRSIRYFLAWSAAIGVSSCVLGYLLLGQLLLSRHQRAAALERYRAVVTGASEGIALVEHGTWRILEANRAFEEMLGHGPGGLEGTRFPELIADSSTAPAPPPFTWSDDQQRHELRLRRKDGSLAETEILACRLSQEGREIWSLLVGDVTERHRASEERTRLENQLRQFQRVEAIGRLAGGVAHDFNNLTAIVLGYGELLLGRLGPDDPSRGWAEQIVEAGRRSAALTRQLLAFSRKQVLLPIVLDLNDLLRNLEKMLGRLIGEDITLSFNLAGDLGRITADPGQIEQVVTNLVINARDAMPQGGDLTIETANVELDETYAREHAEIVPGDYVLLALTDSGCGMDKVSLARLFEPFFTTKEMGKGTGLGLATSYGIVKQSGGYIWAYSEPGRGTTFKIYLPRTDAELTLKEAEAAGETPRGQGESILLVEDESSLRDMCEIVLSRLGYRVSTAGSGPGAMALVAGTGKRPDLVITDVIMPCMSGAELAQRLRKDHPGLKVLYMSGYPDEAITHHGVLEPGISFLQKPFSERSLAVKVREVLGARTAAAQPGRSVLMIDDDEQYRDLVRHFCSRPGHDFAGVGSAAAALAALAGRPFDLLLVDLNIPGTSGERVLREIRAAGHTAPAIVLTGDVTSADMDALRPLGVVRALEKTSNSEPLLLAIGEATRPGPS
jgi:PAS domain S-box-containing protein